MDDRELWTSFAASTLTAAEWTHEAHVRTAFLFAEQHSLDEAHIRFRAGIGFCFGGLAALELARNGAALRAAVSFHGGLVTRAPAEADSVSAAILVCTGASDPFITREHRQAFEDEMTRGNADWQLHLYATAKHGFTERGTQRPGSEYNESADQRSWRSIQALFAEVLV